MVKLFDKRQRSRNNERNWEEDTDVSQHNEDLAQKLRDMRSSRRNELENPSEKKLRRNPDKLNRHFTTFQKDQMVFLRFGSLTDLRFRKRTYAEVADRMKCWLINVYHTVQRYIKNDQSHPPDGRTVRVFRPAITPEIAEEVTKWKRMKSYATLSLTQRVILLKREFPNYRFNEPLLKKIYKEAGVTLSQRQKLPWRSMNKPGIENERRLFATKLAEWIEQERDIIYFDEMSVNLWSITERSLRCW